MTYLADRRGNCASVHRGNHGAIQRVFVRFRIIPPFPVEYWWCGPMFKA